MKKLILALLFLLLSCPVFAETQLAWMGPVITGTGTVSGGSKSCPTDETLFLDQLSTADFYSAFYTADNTYAGQGYFDPGANKTVCTVKIGVRAIAGEGNPIDMKVTIFAMDTNDLGSSPTGTCVSNTVSVTGAGTFVFPGLDCSLVNGTLYGIVLHRADNSYDSDNNLSIFVNDASAYSGGFNWWNASKTYVNGSGTDGDLSMQLYGFTP